MGLLDIFKEYEVWGVENNPGNHSLGITLPFEKYSESYADLHEAIKGQGYKIDKKLGIPPHTIIYKPTRAAKKKGFPYMSLALAGNYEMNIKFMGRDDNLDLTSIDSLLQDVLSVLPKKE